MADGRAPAALRRPAAETPGPRTAAVDGRRRADPRRTPSGCCGRSCRRAYRRPVAEAEEVRFLPVIEGALASGAPLRRRDDRRLHRGALLAGVRLPGGDAGPLDDHALAARLAFFLWNSAPDDELRAARRSRASCTSPRCSARRPSGCSTTRSRGGSSTPSSTTGSTSARSWQHLAGRDALPRLLPRRPARPSRPSEETQLFFAELLRGDLPARNARRVRLRDAERAARRRTTACPAWRAWPSAGCRCRRTARAAGC